MSSTVEELTVVLRADDRRLQRQLATTTRNITRQLGHTATTATRVGQQTGTGFTRGLNQATTRGMSTTTTAVNKTLTQTRVMATRAGTNAGTSFTKALSTSAARGGTATTLAVTKPLDAATVRAATSGATAGRSYQRAFTQGVAPMGRTGQATGRAFSQGVTAATSPLVPQMGQQGRAAGASFGRGFTASVAVSTAPAAASVRSSLSGATASANTTSSAVSGIGASFRGMAGVAASALGAIGITTFAQGVAQVGAQINEARAALTGMYGDADQARDMVSAINSEFRRSSVGVGVLNDLATNLAYLGFEGEEALSVIRNIDTAAGALPGDAAGAVQSVSNALLTAQVQGNAFVGELNQISRIGFPIFSALSEHLGKTTGEIKDMASQGEISFENLMDVMLDPSMSEFWTMTQDASENTAKTFRQSFQGMVSAVQVSFAEMVDSGLDTLAPGMNRVADAVDNALLALPDAMAKVKRAADRWGLTDALKEAADAAKALVVGAGPALAGFAAGFGAALGAVLVVLRPVFRLLRAVGEWMRDNQAVVKTFGMALGVLVGLFVAFKAALAIKGLLVGLLSPIGWVMLAIAGVAAALKYAWDNSETFRRIVTRVWDRVKKAAKQVADFFRTRVWPVLIDGWNEIRDAAGPVVARVLRWFRNLRSGADEFSERWGFLWKAATDTLSDFRDMAKRIGGNLIDQVKGWVDIIAGVLTGDWSRAWGGAKKVVKSGLDNIGAIVSGGGKIVGRALKLVFWDLPKSIAEWIVENAPGIYRKLRDEWIPAFVDWVADADQAIRAELRKFAGRFVRWLANDVPPMIRKRINLWTSQFTDWANDLWPKIRRNLPKLMSALTGWMGTRTSDISRQLGEWTGEFVGWAAGLWQETKDQFNDWGEKLTDWVTDFAQGLPEKLESWTDQVVQWIEDTADSLPEKLEAWTAKFVQWVEDFADSLPERLEQLTERFVEWATSAPEDTANAFEDADGAGKIEEQITTSWGPRLLGALASALLTIAQAVPGMVGRIAGALIGAFMNFLDELPGIFGRAFGNLMVLVVDIWEQISEAILNILDTLKNKAGKKVGEFVGDTLGSFGFLENELVGNSIVPDMVTDIIDETGRLGPGVGNNVGGMSSAATKQAMGMQTSMVARMVAMSGAVTKSLSGMRTSASGVFSGMTSGLTRQLSVLGTQTARLLASMAIAFQRVFVVMGTQATRSFGGMVTALTRLSRTLSVTMTRTFATMGTNIVRGFTNTVRGVSRAMQGIRPAVGNPVRYVISPIYNQGLRPVWNRVADKVPGLSPMAAMAAPRFREGGLVDLTQGGQLSGFSVRDNRLAMVRDGESVLTPAATRGLGGKAFVDAANQAGTGASKLLLEGVGAFSRGGVVSLANGFKRADENYFKNGAPAAARAALNPMADMVGNRYGRGNTFPGQGYHSVRAWNAAAVAQVIKHKDMLEGGDGQAVVNEARKHIGKSGRPNEFMRPYMSGSWPWCGAFVGTTFKRAGAYDALNAVDWKPLVRSYRALPKVPLSAARPGDLPLYRGDDGHVNIVEDPKRRTTIGGNESDSVRRQTGYMNTASSIRRPKFSRGGMIDFGKAFWGQDAADTSDILAPHDSAMRDIFNGVQTYDQGGWLAPGYTLAYNNTGGPEPIGAEPIVVTIDLKGDDKEMMRKIRKHVSIEGGGNVQVALGGGRRR